MNRLELVKVIREILSNAGFYVSDLYSMRPIGFDLVARRDNSLLIIKVLTNINALSEDVASELKLLSKLLKGQPLLIGERGGIGYLEKDVVYDRFGIKTISIDTLESYLLDGNPLKVYAAPGGFYVNLDNEKLINLRKKQNISIGSFARSVKVSRRTVRMYEEGMNARLEFAKRIEELLKDTVTINIDLLNENKERSEYGKNKIPLKNKSDEQFKDLQKEIFSILKQVGYEIIPMGRCPFDAVSKDKDKVLLTCIHKKDKQLIKRARIVGSISKITEKHAVLFTDGNIKKHNIEGTPLIIKKELRKIRGPEEIIELILERMTYNT
jgi:putative transcriptional regulator